MTTDLSPSAQLLLLIMAASGGQMTKADAEREFARVRALSPENYKRWRAIASMRVKYWAEKARSR